MKAIFKKEIRIDPENDQDTYSNLMLIPKTNFCCEKFKNFCKKFTVWSYEQGKFAIVDQINYENHSVQSIDFCPFCGEKIEYEEEKATVIKKNKK
jgi:hypothetical protein